MRREARKDVEQMTLGQEDILKEYGPSRVDIAVALIEGRMESWEEKHLYGLINQLHIAAAKVRLELAILREAKKDE